MGSSPFFDFDKYRDALHFGSLNAIDKRRLSREEVIGLFPDMEKSHTPSYRKYLDPETKKFLDVEQEIIDISAEVSDLDEQDRSLTCTNVPSPMSPRRSAKKKQPFSKKKQLPSNKESSSNSI